MLWRLLYLSAITHVIFIESLWRSVKYEDIYLKSYEDGWQLEKGMDNNFQFYNQERTHQSLQHQTPKKVYKDSCLITKKLSVKDNKNDN
jgi:putative transposase